MAKCKTVSIEGVHALEILDSRGNPTLETTVTLSDGTSASASVPSGASTGKYEATELRDTGDIRYGRMGVRTAVGHVNGDIASVLVGMPADGQWRADSAMITLDGTENRSNLGANATLSVSLALARAAAVSSGIPLYRYLGGIAGCRMPIPMMHVLHGGAHADNNVDRQEFMSVPVGAASFADAMRMGAEIYHALKQILKSSGKNTAVGDEGGFAPQLASDEEAIAFLVGAIEKAGYKPGRDVKISLDAAASEWYEDGQYHLPKRNVRLSGDDLIRYFSDLSEKYPLLSVEDGLGEEDADGWQNMTERLGDRLMLVGDDLFVTQEKRLADGIRHGRANAILIKPNQVGTVSETVRTILLAKRNGYKVIFSHRSGETEDSFLADFAVALGADFIKSGAPARSERLAKYNRLLKIEEELFSPLGRMYG